MLRRNVILQNQHQQAVILVSILSHHEICNFFHHLIMVTLECQNCTVLHHFATSLSSLGSKLSNTFTGICISLWIMNTLTDLSTSHGKSIKSCVQLVFLRTASLESTGLCFGKSISNSSLKYSNPVLPCLSYAQGSSDTPISFKHYSMCKNQGEVCQGCRMNEPVQRQGRAWNEYN